MLARSSSTIIYMVGLSTPYKHVVWDWNGTLIDDGWLSLEITNSMMARRGLAAISSEHYQEIFGFPLRQYVRRLGFDLDAETFEQISDEFIAEYELRRRECRLQPLAAEVLETISAAGLQQSLLSAYEQRSLEEMVAHFQLEEVFAHVWGLGDHYADGKINMGMHWMEEQSCSASLVVLVGDTLHDWETAKAMGVDCVLVPGGHQSRRRLMKTGCRVVSHLTDVPWALQVGP